MRIAPIILGNVISSRFLKRPPRSTNIAWFTGQSYLTEEILPTLDIDEVLFLASPMTQEDHLHVLKQLIHTGPPPQEVFLSYIMVLTLSLTTASKKLYNIDWKDSLFNFCEIEKIIPPNSYSLLHSLLDFLILSHHEPSREELTILVKKHNIPIPSVQELLLLDTGNSTTSLGDILIRSYAAILESQNYGDALKLAIYLSRDTTYISMLVSTICSLMYPLITTKTLLGKQPKRFEYRTIQEMSHIPNTITRFRGPFKFLSNLYATPITYNGLTYCCLEAAYQAQKSLDYTVHTRFANIQLPYKARGMGQRIKPIRSDWFNIRLDIMEELLHIKFSNPQLKECLQRTGKSTLIESNTWGDTFWGVFEGVGENHLGKLLMKVRDTL